MKITIIILTITIISCVGLSLVIDWKSFGMIRSFCAKELKVQTVTETDEALLKAFDLPSAGGTRYGHVSVISKKEVKVWHSFDRISVCYAKDGAVFNKYKTFMYTTQPNFRPEGGVLFYEVEANTYDELFQVLEKVE